MDWPRLLAYIKSKSLSMNWMCCNFQGGWLVTERIANGNPV
jgi:hypothetical protein